MNQQRIMNANICFWTKLAVIYRNVFQNNCLKLFKKTYLNIFRILSFYFIFTSLSWIVRKPSKYIFQECQGTFATYCTSDKCDRDIFKMYTSFYERVTVVWLTVCDNRIYFKHRSYCSENKYPRYSTNYVYW